MDAAENVGKNAYKKNPTTEEVAGHSEQCAQEKDSFTEPDKWSYQLKKIVF